MAAFVLKDAVTTGSAAILCAERHRNKANEEKVEVISDFVNFINMMWVVRVLFRHHLISVMITRQCQYHVQRLRDFYNTFGFLQSIHAVRCHLPCCSIWLGHCALGTDTQIPHLSNTANSLSHYCSSSCQVLEMKCLLKLFISSGLLCCILAQVNSLPDLAGPH